MYRYETHLHTFPVSKCAKADVENNLLFYKAQGYSGVFVTDHFLNGNINVSRKEDYEKRLDFYYSSYEQAKIIGKEIGIDVFSGVELSYLGTDFLVYGLNKTWFLENPQWEKMPISELLLFIKNSGALVIQAHPFRLAGYIDHIRLFPHCIHGVESLNACRDGFTNEMGALFAEKYDLLEIAGTDNHIGDKQKRLAGMEFATPMKDEKDFVRRILAREGRQFYIDLGD